MFRPLRKPHTFSALAAGLALVAPTSLPTDAITRPDSYGAEKVFAPRVISTDAEEYRITFTPDGRTAYFARSSVFFPVSRQATIMETHLHRGRWSVPEVASFSGTYADLDPYLTPDGDTLYFSSIRPVDGKPRDDVDVFRTRRLDDGSWGPVEHVAGTPGTNVGGQPVDDLYPTLDHDGSLLYGSNRDGGYGGFDLWRHVPGHALENLGPSINSDLWEYNPVLAPRRSAILFTRLDPHGSVGGAIHAAERTATGWGASQAVSGGTNTDADEYHPSFSADGRTLYFVRRQLTGSANGDLYAVPAAAALSRL